MPLHSDLRQEFATVRNNVLVPVYGGDRLHPQDETLLAQGGRGFRAWDVYSDIAKDCHAYSVLQKRYMAVVGREWEVVPGGTSRADKKAAEMVKSHLENLSTRLLEEESETVISTAGGFDQTCMALLSAILYGFSLAEILWDQEGSEIYPAEIRQKDLRRFVFVAGERGYKLRLLSTENLVDGVPLPSRKFLVHRFCSLPTEDPYGLGLGTRLFYPTYFKRNTVKFWLVFADKWATPTAVAKHPRNASKEQKQTLLAMLQAIATDSGIVLPEDVAVEFLEAQRTGTISTYKDLVDFCDREISKTVLGETGTTDQSGNGGSRARDQIANEVRIEVAKADADLLSDTLNRTLCRWITDFNVPGAKPPKIWRRFPELEEKFDRPSEAGVVVSLTGAGFAPTREWVAERFDIELTEEEKPQSGSSDSPPDLMGLLSEGSGVGSQELGEEDASATPEQTADMAEVGEPDAPDRYTQQALQQSAPAVNTWLDRVKALIDQSGSLETVKDSLFNLYSELPSEGFAEVMGQALAVAELAGRYEVIQEGEAEFSSSSEMQEAIALLHQIDGMRSLEDFGEISAVYQAIGKRVVALVQNHASLESPLVEARSLEFAAKAKGAGKKKPPTCTKGYSCGYSCIAKNRNCSNPLAGQSKNYADWLTNQVKAGGKLSSTQQADAQAMGLGGGQTKPVTPLPQPQTPAIPVSPVKVNQTELNSKRAELKQRFGKKLVEDAEKNVKRILDDPDTNVYIRVRDSATLEAILGDRFKTAHELGRTDHNIPDLKDRNYLTARARVEAKTLGYDQNTADGDRPIYGYLGGKDLGGSSHMDANAYGSIAIKLKPEVKDRTTFTGADSFKSGIASEVRNPNAASLVSVTRFGYDLNDRNVPAHLSRIGQSAQAGQLRTAANAKTIDDLNALAPTGNRYIEAQIHGKVTPSDIGEIHFTSKGVRDRPSPAIAQFAKDNGVDVFVNGKKLSQQDLDDIITPPKDKRSKRLKDLSEALETGDFATVAKEADGIYKDAQKLTMAIGDPLLKQLYQESGYDGLPTVGTAADVTQAWKDGGVLMTRGVKRAGKDGKDYLRQFQSGDYYTGSGIYGNGTYVGHAGKIKPDGSFQGYDPKTEKADAKRAWSDVAKHNYISSTTCTFRMALTSDANIVTQSQLLKERNDVERKLKNWANAEQQKLLAGVRVFSQADVKAFNSSLKKIQSAYVAKTPQVTVVKTRSTRRGTTMIETQEWEFPSKTGGSALKVTVVRRTSQHSPTDVFEVKDNRGKILATIYQAGKTLRPATIRDVFTQITEQETLKSLNLKGKPVLGQINDPTAARKVKALHDQVQRTREVLGLNPNGHSNLAVIRGYDAVALDQSYEPKTFMILLNRSKVVIQQDELSYRQGSKTGAL